MYKIYKITNKITGLNYIGFTKYTLDRRFNQHWKKSSKESNTKLYRAIQEYNDKSMWSIELVQDNIQENVIEIEKKYINLYNSYENGYNSNVGGTGNASGTYKHPQKIKDFLSSINKGKIPSEKCISESIKSRKGVPLSDEHKKKISQKSTGKNLVERKEIHREFMKNHEYNAESWKLTNTKTGESLIVNNLRKYCRENNLNPTNFYNINKGKLKSYKNWTCVKLKELSVEYPEF